MYTAANGSIAGNGPHNPFLTSTVTFNFAVGGVSAATTISNPIFSFGTIAGNNVPGSSVPEPISLSLVGGGLLALGLFRKRFVA